MSSIKLLAKASTSKEYGTTTRFDNNSEVDSRSSRTSYICTMEDETESAWNPESIPLLQRTIDQARHLGVKRTLSWVAGTQWPKKAEEDTKAKSWHWTRKCKVFLLTTICVIVTVVLLLVPQEMFSMNVITVAENDDYVIDIDQLYMLSLIHI